MPTLLLFVAITGAALSATLTIKSFIEQRVLNMSEKHFQRTTVFYSKALERFIETHYAMPSDLTELVSYDNHFLSEDMQFIDFAKVQVSNVGLTYEKALLWHKRYDKYLNSVAVTEDNQLNNSVFSDGQEFKPPSYVYWYQTTTLSTFSKLRTQIYTQLDESAQRLVNSVNTLPIQMFNGVKLEVGDSVLLKDAVGFTGTFETCSGVFEFDGAALTCSDLFAIDGSYVRYQKYTDTKAALWVDSNFLLDESNAPYRLLTSIETEVN